VGRDDAIVLKDAIAIVMLAAGRVGHKVRASRISRVIGRKE
jgi:hypothetical protein